MKSKVIMAFVMLAFSVQSLNAYAGLVLSGTRLIFDGNKNESTINVSNPDTNPYLVQSWVSLNDKKAPNFIVTPPLFRLEGKSSNALRVVLTKNNLPQDHESLFWLNVKGIAPSNPEAQNTLNISINTQIKLIYRPKGLQEKDASAAYEKLTFKVDTAKQALIADNPTAYYINLSELKFNGQAVDNAGFVAPFSQATWPVKPKASNRVEWSAINDFGGTTSVASQKLN
ncbi:molecular chaperone [Orbus sturtevantii]|uniref:fimbrial biogenesis chaperone n=1 Tax=Orbus sturtevantii TaxID=3074109 RepID=UPI00370D19A3